MKFSFQTAGKILFGCGVSSGIGEIAGKFGNRVLLITGKDSSRTAPIREILCASGMKITDFSVPGEPDIELMDEAAILVRETTFEVIIGIGGGSVLDAGKAVSILAANDGEVTDYLEIIGKGRKLKKKPIPYIAVPTTSGTGSEVTKNAVLKSRHHNVKISLRSPFMFPAVAVVDPELTLGMPPSITAGTGMDALVQNIEPIVSRKANPICESMAWRGLAEAASHLLPAFRDGSIIRHREGMSIASLSGGIALANSGLGAVHGFAGALGGMFDAPHGAVCGRLLPFVMEENIGYFEKHDSDNPALEKFRRVAVILTRKNNASPLYGVEQIFKLIEELKIPPLSAFGLSEEKISQVVEKARNSSSMKGNPVDLSDRALNRILEKAL